VETEGKRGEGTQHRGLEQEQCGVEVGTEGKGWHASAEERTALGTNSPAAGAAAEVRTFARESGLRATAMYLDHLVHKAGPHSSGQ
jgi:hypothetical protein